MKTIKYTVPPQLSFAEKQEQTYQNNLSQFLQDNQNYDEQETRVFDELYYLKYRIGLLKKVAKEWQKTVDHSAGLYLDGMELIEGNLITTKIGTVEDLKYAKIELLFLKEKKENFEKSLDKKQTEDVKFKAVKENYTSTNWFKIGFMFATGEMQILLKKSDNNFTQIARQLCNETGYRPYISETKNNTNTNDKNIYSQYKKLKLIQEYCDYNMIELCTDFKDNYNIIQSKNI